LLKHVIIAVALFTATEIGVSSRPVSGEYRKLGDPVLCMLAVINLTVTFAVWSFWRDQHLALP
jgi:hypothetical protein